MQNAEYKSITVLHEQISGDGGSFKSLKEVRLKNLSLIVLAHLNINYLRNKFDALVEQVSGNVDALVLSERKIDESFPEGQFKIPGFCRPFRLDRLVEELWYMFRRTYQPNFCHQKLRP